MIFSNYEMNLTLVSENGQAHYHYACIHYNLIIHHSTRLCLDGFQWNYMLSWMLIQWMHFHCYWNVGSWPLLWLVSAWNWPVYAVDGKKVGLLRSILADYLLVKKGFIVLNKYYIPKTLAEPVDKKGRIRLRITAFEVRANYTYSKMKYLLTAIGYLPEQRIKQRSSYDRLQTIRYSTTRNRLAACIAFVSAILFLASGYKANIEIYNLVAKEVFAIQTLREFWNFVIVA